jgi:hypothetical protein
MANPGAGRRRPHLTKNVKLPIERPILALLQTHNFKGFD